MDEEPTAASEDSVSEQLADTESRQQAAGEARDRRTWLWLSAAGAAVLVLFLLAFWPVMAGRLAAAKQLDEAATLLGKASGTVGGIDKLVTDQLSAEPSKQIRDISAESLVARRELKQAQSLLNDAMPHLTEDEQRRGELIRSAAEARLKMLDSAPLILKTSTRAAAAKEFVDSAVAQFKLADQSEKRANALYKQQTALGVRSASDLYALASGSLKIAQSTYSQAATAFPGVDFAGYQSYLDMRRGALKTALLSASVWLDGDVPGGQLLHDAYVAQNKQAVAAAEKLPSAPSRAVGDAFKRVAGRSRDIYEKARTQADNAEKALKSQ